MNIANWKIADSQGNLITSDSPLDLGATGINEVLQNIKIIVTTQIGTVMLDRRFGINWRYVDAPQNVAELMILQDFCYALSHFEPRAQFKRIQFSPNKENPGELDCQLQVDINAQEITTTNR